MGQVRAIPATASPDRNLVPEEAVTLSILFDSRGVILFQDEAARRHFRAPPDTKRAASAFIRHFADRAEGPRVFAQAAAGQPIRLETRVHTDTGIGARDLEISLAAGTGGDTAIMLIERPVSTRHDIDRIRAFAQAGADWFWETDSTLRITLLSDRPDLTATSLSADFIGRIIHEPLPGLEGLDYAGLRQAMERRELFRDFGFSRRDPAGRRRHFSVSGAPVFGADGTFLGYRGTGRDRTQSVEAEEQAAMAQARLAAAIESIPEAFILFDRCHRLAMCNNRFREDNAAIAAWLQPGVPAAELVAACRRAGITIPAIEFVANSASVDFDGRAVEQQSGDRWFQLGARRTEEGGFAVVQTDVTAIKRREAELAEKSALLRATLDNMHQGVLVNDADIKVVMWNDRFLEMNGLTPDAIRVGMNAVDLVRAAAANGEYGAGEIEATVAQRLEQMRGASAGKARLRPNGSVVEHHTNRMPGGLVIRTYTDITALKRREREIEETGQLLRATLDNMEQGIIVLDADSNLRMWNERVVEQYSLPLGFLRVGLPMIEVLTQIARQGELGEGDPKALAEARVVQVTGENGRIFARRLKNGTVIERRRRDMPGGGSVLTHTDITALVERESEIAEQHALMAGTLANIDQGILVLDADLKIRLWNDRVPELLNLPPGVCQVGRSMTEIVAALRVQQGLPPDKVAAAVAARIGDFSKDHVVTLPAQNFGGRIIERRRRGLPDGGMVLTYTDMTETRRHESEIAEKSALLAATLESMDQGIMVIDADRKVRMWNSRMIEQHDLPKDFMKVGMSASEVIHQLARQGEYGDGDPQEVGLNRVQQLERDPNQVFKRRHSNGFMIERRRRPMPDGGTVLTYTDISALSERERALEQKSTHLTATLASMDQGMLVFGADGTIQTWNQRAVELLSLAPDFLHLDLRIGDFIRALVTRRGGTTEEIERDIVTFQGELRGSSVRVFDGAELNGRVLERRSRPMPDGGLVITYSDVTERKRREDVIAENSALLSATLDNMDQGLIVIDAQHHAKLWNNRLIEMFDLPPDVMRVGRPFEEILHYFIESAGTPPEQVEARLAERLIELDGEPMPLLDRYRPDGRVIERRRRVMPFGGSVITYGDVTARKHGEAALQRAKEEAEIASRSKTEFLANMSHELRTPLNAIIGFSDILVRQLFGPIGQERYAEYAKDIHDSGQHLLNLINDVLDIAKIEVNKIELAEEPIDVPAVIESCVRLMRDRAVAAEVTLEVKMPERLPNLHADDRRLKQILLNLVSNAVKFTPPGGNVEIRVETDASGFRFVVADTGIGIAKADLQTALTPFGQIDSSLSRRYEGTGLGLPLARSMAELHGGRLDIESEPGTGTTVTVSLPASRVTRH